MKKVVWSVVITSVIWMLVLVVLFSLPQKCIEHTPSGNRPCSAQSYNP